MGRSKGALLLTNGLTYTLLDWPHYFVKAFVDDGYHVIRYDNRDVGMSDRDSDWTKETSYNLRDMVNDAVSVMDHLSIAKAHIVGVSMGGMISQQLVIDHPDRALSLTSIMSSGYFYDPDLASEPFWFKAHFVKSILKYGRVLKETSQRMKFHLAIQHICAGRGDYDVDSEGILAKSYYELSKRKGYNPKSQERHGMAIKKSGSRYEGLKTLNLPVLVIHGTDDPLIKFEHAVKYSAIIPGVKTLFVDGMGHDLPKAFNAPIVDQMVTNFEEA